MLLLYIFLMVMLFSLIPYLKIITKRASAAAGMKRACEASGGKFVTTNPFWYIGLTDAKKCDAHILKDGRIISVKIIGFFSTNTVVDLRSAEEYATNILKKNFDDPSPELCKPKKKAPYDFSYKLPEEWKKLPKARIILVADPYPIKLYSEGEEVKIGSQLSEGELYDVESFIKLFV